MQDTRSDTPLRYELVPLFDLPEVDLSVSIRSHYVRHPTLHRLIRVISASVLTFAGFILYLTVCIAVFVVPAPIGRVLAVVGVFSGFWAAVLSIGNLRLDVVLVLAKTYDIWFFTTVSTLVSVLLGLLLRDPRSVLVVLSWLAFLTNIFIDASVVGMRRLWIANAISAGCYVLMALTVSVNVTDDLVAFNIFRLNGHALPAVAAFRDGATSMFIVILRNLYRKARHMTKLSQVSTIQGAVTVECVSFRCRLRVKAVSVSHSLLPAQSSLTQLPEGVEATSATKKTRFQLRSFLEPMDPTHTCLPLHRLLLVSGTHRTIFRSLGIVGFVSIKLVLACAYMLPKLKQSREMEVLSWIGLGGSVVFISICLAATHRQLLYAVVTSFDCAFIAAQAFVGILSLLDLSRWDPVLVAALVGDLLWIAWLLSWDALLPPTRAELKLTPRFAAFVGSGIAVSLVLSAISVFVVLHPREINDRAVWNADLAGRRIELRPLSWFTSCLATLFAWGVRLNWRVWQAADTELVILDGPVVYEAMKARARTQKVQNTTTSPTMMLPLDQNEHIRP